MATRNRRESHGLGNSGGMDKAGGGGSRGNRGEAWVEIVILGIGFKGEKELPGIPNCL